MILPIWLSLLTIWYGVDQQDWGFFAHRKINRFAVYTLPDPLFDFYKRHQGYLEYHAVDPDKRRYAVKKEALFHYLDMDVFQGSVDSMEDLRQQHWKYGEILLKIDDRVVACKRTGEDACIPEIPDTIAGKLRSMLGSIHTEDSLTIPFLLDSVDHILLWRDSFSGHGLLPYRIIQMAKSLENAFAARDVDAILRLSADIGHYIGDAHVPLHTTSNYNGQLTGQHGIHAFWESRLPELFLHEKHFLAIRPAKYFHSVSDSVWMLLSNTNSLVDRVFECEREARQHLPEDEINCYDSRNGQYGWMPCPQFADAFDTCLGGMVWEQWESSIQFLGSIWYTAWANAGEPELPFSNERSNAPKKREENGPAIGSDMECHIRPE